MGLGGDLIQPRCLHNGDPSGMLRSPVLISRDLGQLHHGMSFAVNAHCGDRSILNNIDGI
jgi:hypothetical protein